MITAKIKFACDTATQKEGKLFAGKMSLNKWHACPVIA